MLIDAIKGYQICEIFKRRARKENFGDGLAEIVPRGILQEEVLNVLKGKGRVFGLYSKKDKLLKACYIMERVTVKSSEIPYQKIRINKDNVWEFVKTGTVKEEKDEERKSSNEELEGASRQETIQEIMEEEKVITVYKLTRQYCNGVEEEVLLNFEKFILEEIKEAIAMNQIDAQFMGNDAPEAIIWKDKALRPSKVKAGSYGYLNAIPLGIGVGAALGIALDNILLGMCLGFLWAVVFGTAFTTSKFEGMEIIPKSLKKDKE